jgi:hypothetical protein
MLVPSSGTRSEVPTLLPSPRTLLTTVLALLAAAGSILALTACGSTEEEARETIDTAFSEPIDSADLALNLDIEAEGSEELSEPVRVQLTGPFQNNGPDQIPSFDFDVSLQAPGAEAVPPFGLTSTGDNVFVELQGTAYEVGEDIVAQQNQQLAQQSEESQSLSAFGIDPQNWVVEPTVEDDEEIAGAETTHVSAAIDVPALLEDLNEAVGRAAELSGGAAPATELPEETRAQIEEAVENPTFDVFAGKDDGKLRRLDTELTFTVPEEEQAAAAGATGGTVAFSLELADVDGEQEIVAPANPRPLSDLAAQLGGLGGLLGGSTAPGTTPPPLPGTPPPGGAPDPQALEEFSQCVNEADPSDPAALQRCNELINPTP